MEDAAAGTFPTSSGGSTGSTSSGSAPSDTAKKDSIAAINQRAHAAVDKAAEFASHTSEWLAKSPKEFSEKTADYVKAKPMQSVGIAFVSGLLLGKLLR